MVENNRLQLSALTKWFRLSQDVLSVVQNVLKVLSAAGKLCNGTMAGLAYRTQIQKLLNRGHSLDTVVGVHEEFLMHLHKHNSFNIAGDTVLGKSLFQSLCTDLPPPSSFHVQCNSWGSSTCGPRGSGQRTSWGPLKDSCNICGGDRGEHLAANCSDRKGRPSRGCGNRGTGQGGRGSFSAAPTPGAGETNSVRM